MEQKPETIVENDRGKLDMLSHQRFNSQNLWLTHERFSAYC